MPLALNTHNVPELATESSEDGESVTLELDAPREGGTPSESQQSSESTQPPSSDSEQQKSASSSEEHLEQSPEPKVGDGKVAIEGFELLTDLAKKVPEKPVEGRNYDGLDEQEVTLLKKSANETFEYVAPRLKEYKEIKSKYAALEKEYREYKTKGGNVVTQSALDHPEAYRLDPKFNEALKDYQDFSFEIEHWTRQLAEVDQEKDMQNLVFDPKTGQYSYETIPYDPTLRSKVMRALNNAQLQTSQLGKQLVDYQTAYKSRREHVVNRYREANDKYFPEYKDEKHASQKYVKVMMEQLKVDGLENDVLAPILARAFAKLIDLQVENNRLKQGTTKTEAIKKDQQKAGPSSGEIHTASGGKQEKILDVNDFALD